MQKNDWRKPELIVLVRSKPEEAVLVGCKSLKVGFTGASSKNNMCIQGSLPCATICSSTIVS